MDYKKRPISFPDMSLLNPFPYKYYFAGFLPFRKIRDSYIFRQYVVLFVADSNQNN